MRKSHASLNDPLEEKEIVNFQDNKCKRRCLASIWFASNIATFILGYYIKSKYFEDCKVDTGGSY
mgnify:CR=1 FL=1